MSKRRDEVLGLLGVERWLSHSADASLSAAPVVHAPAVVKLPPALPIVVPSDMGIATDWEGLRAQVSDCQRCKLCATRTNTVFGVGNPDRKSVV